MKIKEIIDRGYIIEMGQHRVGEGYFATITAVDDPECSECERPFGGDWYASGHGDTPKAALKEAVQVRFYGKQTRSPNEFGIE